MCMIHKDQRPRGGTAEAAASLRDGTALKALTQVEINSRNLRGPSMDPSQIKSPMAKPKNIGMMQLSKAPQTRRTTTFLITSLSLTGMTPTLSYRETLISDRTTSLRCNSTGLIQNSPQQWRTQHGKTRRRTERLKLKLVRKSSIRIRPVGQEKYATSWNTLLLRKSCRRHSRLPRRTSSEKNQKNGEQQHGPQKYGARGDHHRHPRLHRAHGLGRVGNGVSSQPVDQYLLFCELFPKILCALLALVGRNTRILHPQLHLPGTLAPVSTLLVPQQRFVILSAVLCFSWGCLGERRLADSSEERSSSPSHMVRLNIVQRHLTHGLRDGHSAINAQSHSLVVSGHICNQRASSLAQFGCKLTYCVVAHHLRE